MTMTRVVPVDYPALSSGEFGDFGAEGVIVVLLPSRQVKQRVEFKVWYCQGLGEVPSDSRLSRCTRTDDGNAQHQGILAVCTADGISTLGRVNPDHWAKGRS